ncbi:hypothetical protein [Meiothermus taiwanensis]|nr:hypothetical protein [Meiothermus taiwanensis]
MPILHNEVGPLFAHIHPASTVLEVSRLAEPEMLVEIEVDAIVS